MTEKALPGDPAWLKAAFSKLGLSEIAGARHEKQVLEMYAASGHPEISNDETAWCAAFVGWCLRQAGLPNTGSLMARSYVKYGARLPHGKIPRGAICVWPRGKPPSGHVNFCLHDDGETLTLIGGNQGNGRGGGVTITDESKDHLIEAVWPKPVSKPEPLPPPPDIEPPPEPEQPKPGLLKRFWMWITGGGLGALGIGLTDWQALLVLCAFLLIVGALVVWFMGPERVRAWIRKQVNR